VKVLALDYGSARTGVAVSDPTGTLARPLGTIDRVGEPAGFDRLLDVIAIENPERIVVGLPLTLRGEHGEQARETQSFIAALASASGVEIVPFDERFTTNLAEQMASASADEDALAAAHLLSSYLTWSTAGA
jgi:putative Holliday junction resolvase